MAVSIYQLGHKKLSQIIFEWQAADRASLLALFIVIEVTLHWLWCLFVWLRQDLLHSYVDMSLLYPVWAGVTAMMLFFWWLVAHLSRIKNNDDSLHHWQIVLIVVYSIYIAFMILVMGHSSLVSGVSLVGGAMLGMMLVRRRYIWRAFLTQVVLIVLITIIPYLGVSLPNLRQLTMSSLLMDGYSYVTYSEMHTIENAIATSLFKDGALSWDKLTELRRSSAFFWRSTHLYLALPKALFIVYVFRALLLILDNSKDEIIKYANQDELTGLNNRRYGLTQMQQVLMASNKQSLSVILLDLDLFKDINDNYGHEVGDQVLREVAQLLRGALSDEDILSRYGGEEFLIVLPQKSHGESLVVADRLRRNIAQHVIEGVTGARLQITASLGLYTLTHNELDTIKRTYLSADYLASSKSLNRRQNTKPSPHDLASGTKMVTSTAEQRPSDICQRLISTADQALYKAKDRGRNQVVSANDLLVEGSISEPRYGT